MTRSDQIKKWTVYTLALLLVLLLDCAVLAQFPIYGVCPILLPLAVSAVALLESSQAGATFGFFVGLLWAGGYAGSHGSRIFLLTLTGLVIGRAAQYVISRSFLGYLICSSLLLLVLELWQVGVRLFIHFAPAQDLLQVATVEFAYTMVWAPLLYLFFSFVHSKVGGTRLA